VGARPPGIPPCGLHPWLLATTPSAWLEGRSLCLSRTSSDQGSEALFGLEQTGLMVRGPARCSPASSSSRKSSTRGIGKQPVRLRGLARPERPNRQSPRVSTLVPAPSPSKPTRAAHRAACGAKEEVLASARFCLGQARQHGLPPGVSTRGQSKPHPTLRDTRTEVLFVCPPLFDGTPGPLESVPSADRSPDLPGCPARERCFETTQGKSTTRRVGLRRLSSRPNR
jgi:hypothetical protein